MLYKVQSCWLLNGKTCTEVHAEEIEEIAWVSGLSR